MKIIDLETGKTIEEFDNELKHNFFTTKKYWEEYKKNCKEFGDYHEKQLLYGKFIEDKGK